MDEATETALLNITGRVSALGIAIAKLIELSTNPAGIRVAFREQAEGVLAVFEASIDSRHLSMADGLREQMEELLDMG